MAGILVPILGWETGAAVSGRNWDLKRSFGGGGGSRTRVRKCYWSEAYMRSHVHALGITQGRSRPPLRTDKKRLPLA